MYQELAENPASTEELQVYQEKLWVKYRGNLSKHVVGEDREMDVLVKKTEEQLKQRFAEFVEKRLNPQWSR